ncbi:MAG TPA: GNAT family N-acetyltransferase [Actinomycetota bacterium]|nr:GNAT family N-acetyltransferase [Actinomycetota bacterium]
MTDAVTLRPAAPQDLPFLTEMAARFGGAGPDSPAIRGWMVPDWDLGFIAERDGSPAGAGWWRRFTGFTGGGSDRTAREVFVAVAAAHEGTGLGSSLLDALIDAARTTGAVHLLAARPRHDVGTRMLETRGFERKDAPYPHVDPVWTLELRER